MDLKIVETYHLGNCMQLLHWNNVEQCRSCLGFPKWFILGVSCQASFVTGGSPFQALYSRGFEANIAWSS